MSERLGKMKAILQEELEAKKDEGQEAKRDEGREPTPGRTSIPPVGRSSPLSCIPETEEGDWQEVKAKGKRKSPTLGEPSQRRLVESSHRP